MNSEFRTTLRLLKPEKRRTQLKDEKPGLQAVANPAPDLPPLPGKHSGLGRDHEYKRLGTGSILAALDPHSGHVTARVERRQRISTPTIPRSRSYA